MLNPKKSGRMKTSGGSFLDSVLIALSDRQLLALEDWNKQRRLDPSTQPDAVKILEVIMHHKHNRGLSYDPRK